MTFREEGGFEHTKAPHNFKCGIDPKSSRINVKLADRKELLHEKVRCFYTANLNLRRLDLKFYGHNLW